MDIQVVPPTAVTQVRPTVDIRDNQIADIQVSLIVDTQDSLIADTQDSLIVDTQVIPHKVIQDILNKEGKYSFLKREYLQITIEGLWGR